MKARRTRVLYLRTRDEVEAALRQLKVAPQGVEIMTPKGLFRAVKVEGISSAAASILKQEMLSRGGEVATPADVYYLKEGEAQAIIMGTMQQFADLERKMRQQPPKLASLAEEIEGALLAYDQPPVPLLLGSHRIGFESRTAVVGVLDLAGAGNEEDLAVRGQQMVGDGADALQVGLPDRGRPDLLSAAVGVITRLVGSVSVPVGAGGEVDAAAAGALLQAGASFIEDLGGTVPDDLLDAMARTGAGIIITASPHQLAVPPSPLKQASRLDDLYHFFQARSGAAQGRGVLANQIALGLETGLLDPEAEGVLLSHACELKALGHPTVVDLDVAGEGTADQCIGPRPAARLSYGVVHGVSMVRTRSVKGAVELAKVLDAMRKPPA